MTDALGRVAMTSPSDPRRNHATPPGTTATRNRYSVASDEVGESSSRNSEQQERSTDDTYKPVDPSLTDLGRKSHGRGSHRSHRRRTSGGFLLSDNTFFEPPAHETRASTGNQLTPPIKRQQRRDHKGKVPVRPKTDLTNGGSPSATHIKQADAREKAHTDGSNTEENGGKVNVDKTIQTGLDVDSAQIVNLALNLSESRRQAARRVVTVPSPPTIHGFEDTFGGGSLRQHLQAQRRSSRNISPKPDKGEKFGVPPKPAQPITSPLQTAFTQDVEQKYQFSAATLARAEKAKNAFELMAQYRRLLQYLPPLKSQGLTPVPTISPPGTSAGVPVRPNTLSRASTATNKQIGRPYNPLQYIRNRKVRARERQPIDGEAQGFGDVDDVTAWVDRVVKHCPSDGYEISDCLELPPLGPDEAESQAHVAVGADPSKPAVPPVKVKRPRIDWMISAPNMLADIVWLEQSDNKKLIEDNRERKIFPPSTNLVRLPTRTSEEQLRHLEQQQHTTDQEAEEEESAQSPDAKSKKHEKLHVETRLPAFNSIRRSGRNGSDTNHTPKIRHKLHKVARKLDSAGPLRSHSRVDSYSSDSDDSLYNAQMRRGRSDTADSYALNHDILEKQMSQMIAKETDEESKESLKEVPEKIEEEKKPASSVEVTPSPVVPRKSEESDTLSPRKLIARKPRPELHRQNWSLNYGDKAAPLGRSSPEVPGQRPSEWPSSDLDTTAPNSPESKAAKLLNALIPSISMDLSPPHSPLSPTHSHRMPLERVRSKINRLRDRSAEPLGRRRRKGEPDLDADRKPSLQESPGTPLGHIRSLSPRKRPAKGSVDNTIESPSAASLARQRPKDGSPPNMAGKPKSRNPIARVSNLLWTKDDTSASDKQGDTAPEDTDIDENDFESSKEESESNRRNSIITDQGSTRSAASRKVKALLGEMSTFISPTERRGRPTDSRNPTQMSPDYDAQTQQQKAHAKQRQDRLDRLKPPRIDIQRASGDSSPKITSRVRSPQGSLLRVHSADARLNSILNIPGISPMRTTFLPATDLAALTARRPSLGSRPRDPSAEPTHITRQDVARVRALLLSSGIKAKELTRRHNELRDLNNAAAYRFATMAQLVPDLALERAPRAQEHLLAARVLEEDMRRSARAWEAAAEAFRDGKMVELGKQVGLLQEKLDGPGGLSEQGKKAADEADELAKEVMGSQMLRAKALAGAMDAMMRRRRRRFRWARRGGWVLVEWVLVGVMWWAWLVVVLLRLVRGLFRGVVGVGRWLFWL
ncbi:hypothetical protein VC83_03614 [Pseudogymnoascus destructans]|uniref:Uncharacterized protein n=2 Tax=Pseudogymnoascus destructans TaxID=655981 RepID=L8FWW2_PSED2|nr:uncharacterized protein VC83_03614 [Pseudogymnoascus destructans]ELR05450.1 hypothetical protein GMDG_01745 [Pseudogymnoascus destructans 20631-21]OAF60671.1 hypothetical protein VC83_03614 [Pseudogymnoascus destructans]